MKECRGELDEEGLVSQKPREEEVATVSNAVSGIKEENCPLGLIMRDLLI